MRKTWTILAAVAVLLSLAAGAAQADFVLNGTQHMDVTTTYVNGTLYNSSSVNVFAGGITGTLAAWNASGVSVYGGNVQYIDSRNASSVNVFGGSVHDLSSRDASSVAVSGGEIDGTVASWSAGSLTVSGGHIQYLDLQGAGSVAVTGGNIAQLDAKGGSASHLDISGGNVTSLYAQGTSVDISGGNVSALAAYLSTIAIHGRDFGTTGGVSLTGDLVLGDGGTLTGKWSDGTPWTMLINENSGATILAVPEPATLSLLALGGLAMLRRKRNRP